VALTDRERLRLLELEEEELQLQAAQKATQKSEEKPGISTLESGLRGAAQGATLGFSDEITGGAEAAYSKLTGDERSLSDIYSKSRDESRLANKLSEEENPGTYTASNLGAGLATMLVPGLNIAKGASLAKAGIQGAKIGAASGLGASDEEIASMGALKDMSMGAGFGGAFGAGGQKLGNMISKVDPNKIAEATSGKMKNSAENFMKDYLMERGSTSKLLKTKSKEYPNQLARQALDENNTTLFSNSADEIERNAESMARQGDVRRNIYDLIDETETSQFDPVKLSKSLKRKFGKELDPGLNADSAELGKLDDMTEILRRSKEKRLDEIQGLLNNKNINPIRARSLMEEAIGIQTDNPNLKLQDAQKLLEKMQNATKFDTNKPMPKDTLANDVYKATREKLNSSLHDSADLIEQRVSEIQNILNDKNINPKDIKPLMEELIGIETKVNKIPGADVSNIKRVVQDANQKMSRSFDLENLYNNKFARDQNKKIGFTDWMTLSGEHPAIAIPKKLFETYGNKGAALGLDKLGDLVKNNAQAFGKFQNVLQGASQKGGNALGATHYMLYQQNPEYREMLKKQQDGEE